jgi:hypothetical protein
LSLKRAFFSSFREWKDFPYLLSENMSALFIFQWWSSVFITSFAIQSLHVDFLTKMLLLLSRI